MSLIARNLVLSTLRRSLRAREAPPTLTSTIHPSRRHQSTVPQSNGTAQPPQTQQPAATPAERHPSSVSHPALSNHGPKGGDSNAVVLIFLGLLAGAAPLSYWYWGHRERAMKAKKEEMLKGIQERYAARHGGG